MLKITMLEKNVSKKSSKKVNGTAKEPDSPSGSNPKKVITGVTPPAGSPGFPSKTKNPSGRGRFNAPPS